LVNQNFPKSKYEIIVVDDGSTDKTLNIVKEFPVKLIQHKKNQGVATARNTGLKAANGKIYICFDDDCFADKDWLKNLEKAYQKFNINKVIGIAGFIKLIGNGGIIDKYMYEIGYANPSPVIYGLSTNPIIRFYAYLKNMFSPTVLGNEKVLEVNEIWGANCSFPVSVLKKVNGWDPKMSGVEDTELCDRIKKAFPGQNFICTKDAIIIHDHQLNLKSFINKPYSRGPVTLRFYLKNSKIPPFFPFPPVMIACILGAIVLNPMYGLIALIILPQIFYAWWGLNAIKKHTWQSLIFPYLQSSYELSSIVGLMKGLIYAK
jgi:glycosyltransferase involved in cell wall biosynthesis